MRHNIEHIRGLHVLELGALEVERVVQVIEVQVRALFGPIDICDRFVIHEIALRTNLAPR